MDSIEFNTRLQHGVYSGVAHRSPCAQERKKRLTCLQRLCDYADGRVYFIFSVSKQFSEQMPLLLIVASTSTGATTRPLAVLSMNIRTFWFGVQVQVQVWGRRQELERSTAARILEFDSQILFWPTAARAQGGGSGSDRCHPPRARDPFASSAGVEARDDLRPVPVVVFPLVSGGWWC